MKKKSVLLFVLLLILVAVFLYKKPTTLNAVKTLFVADKYINKEGKTISSRVKIPEGFTRVTYSKESFENYLQEYALKPYGSKIINFDDTEYFYQSGHYGILELPVPKNGLQQCADALIRLRSEFLWKSNQKNKIGFEFTSGHYCSWKKYAQGFRPKINGNKVTFHKTAAANASKENFYKYLNLIFTYSGTLSLYTELPKVKKQEDLHVGDMLVNPGTPGHIVLIVDEIKNEKGDTLFLLAEGNTPAQSVHLLKNPNDLTRSPWYQLSINNTIETPLYHFNESKFIRFK